jgi:hypothetical protein
LVNGSETYDDIGQIKTLVFLPDGLSAVGATRTETSLASRFGKSWKLFCKLWFAPFATKQRLSHVTSNTSAIGRFGFALLTILLTPILMPVGLVFVFIHALKPPSALRRHDDGHEHKPDGSCCGEL